MPLLQKNCLQCAYWRSATTRLILLVLLLLQLLSLQDRLWREYRYQSKTFIHNCINKLPFYTHTHTLYISPRPAANAVRDQGRSH